MTVPHLDMPTYKLISFELCPFVQRATITLEEKAIPYAIEYVDLTAKPAWFLELSPTGKVPLLLVADDTGGQTVLFESVWINEYLDEVTPGRLSPSDPLQKAQQRAMTEFSSLAMHDTWRLMVTEDRTEFDEHRHELHSKLRHFEKNVIGPFYAGETFSLVDAATIPLLIRVGWMEEIMPEIELFAGLAKVRAWHDAALVRPSVQRSAVPDVRELFRDYVRGKRGTGGNVAPGVLGQRIS
jgi:glutathione S-transferase